MMMVRTPGTNVCTRISVDKALMLGAHCRSIGPKPDDVDLVMRCLERRPIEFSLTIDRLRY